MKLERIFGVGLATALLVTTFFVPVQTARAQTCTSVASCSAEQQRLKQQQQDAKNKYEQSKKEAQNLQGVISDLQADISYTQGRITNAEDQIRVTEEILTALGKDIDVRQKRLTAAYISLYELSRTNQTPQLLLQDSLNDALSEAQYIQSIQTQLQKDLASLKGNKAERERQKADLETQKTSLETDKNELAAKRNQQSYLLSTAQKNANYYQGLSADIQKKITEIERKLSVLISQQSWGSDIVSVNQGSWYYSQLNYPDVRLGSSPYTVAQYGCLITSIAMVSTFYGRAVTPPQIAGYPGNFDSQGYLLKQPPLPVKFSSMSSASVNWATVNSELDAGRPVILSIYIPSVGVINADGSSHFIVVHGRSGAKYFMHDPLGANRSYAAKYVKSMKVIRN